MNSVSDELDREPEDEVQAQYPNLLRFERNAIRARGSRLPSGTKAGSSPLPPPNHPSAPLNTPTTGTATGHAHVDLGTSEPNSFRVHYNPFFQRIQVSVSGTHPIVDVPGGSSILGSNHFTFTPPPFEYGLHTPTPSHLARVELAVTHAPIITPSVVPNVG